MVNSYRPLLSIKKGATKSSTLPVKMKCSLLVSVTFVWKGISWLLMLSFHMSNEYWDEDLGLGRYAFDVL